MSALIVEPVDLDLILSDDEYITGVIYNADGSRKNLTAGGVGLVCTISNAALSLELLTKSIGSGITVDANGNYSVHIADTDSPSIAVTVRDEVIVAYALQLTDTSGDKTTPVYGQITFHGTSNR